MRKTLALSFVVIFFGFAHPAHAGRILQGATSDRTKIDAGFFTGTLDITVTGVIDLLPQTGYHWLTNPDGSLFSPVTEPTYSRYANAGSTLYPTVAGGDGINHFVGGGANYDTAIGPPNGQFGFAGAMTTDTTDPGDIRFGAVVYAFSPTPTHADWHFLGLGQRIVMPQGGSHLYLAVNDSDNDSFPGVNSGSYDVQITAVPAPGSLTLAATGLLACAARLWGARRRRPCSVGGLAAGARVPRARPEAQVSRPATFPAGGRSRPRGV